MPTFSISPGAAAPPFTLQALGSGRSVSHVGPAPLLLVFDDHGTVRDIHQDEQIQPQALTMVARLLGLPAVGQAGQ